MSETLVVGQVAVAMLAGGLSSRYGDGDKLLADLHGKPLIQHAANTVSELPWLAQLAIVAPGKPQLAKPLSAAGFEVVVTDAPPHGIGYSIAKAAAAALETPALALLICLGDMPFVTAETLQRLVAALAVEPNRAIAGCDNFSAERGMTPPVLFRRCYFPELTELSGDNGGKSLIQRYADQVVTFTLPAEQCRDFDCEADFQQA